MKSLSLRRREFLKAIGASPALLPLLDFDKKAHAQSARPNKFVAWVWPNGVSNEYWPGGAGALSFTETLKPLEAHKDDVLVVDNMAIKAMSEQSCCRDFGGHPSTNWILTAGDCKPGKYDGEDLAIGNVRSVDLVIADHLAKSRPTPYLSLPMGIDNKEETSLAYKYVTFNGAAAGSTPNAPKVEDDVLALYKKLFSNGTPGQNAGLDKVVAARKSILDYTGRALERFAQNLGSESKQLVDLHLQGVRDIEKQLGAPGMGGAPMPGSPPTIDMSINSYDKKAYDKIGKAQLDLLVAALASGMTSVASLMWSNGHNNTWVFYWLGAEFTEKITNGFWPTIGHHDIAHAGGTAEGSGLAARRKKAVDRWFHTQLAYLMDELKKRSILKETLIYFTNNMGNGASHSTTRVPMIVAGGGVKGGRLLRPGGERPHNQLLVSIANAFGIEQDWVGTNRYKGGLPGFSG